MHKNEISLVLRTTTSRFYRADVSQFSYTSKCNQTLKLVHFMKIPHWLKSLIHGQG